MRPNARIEITGLKELRERFAQFPDKFNKAVLKTLEAVLFILSGAVPPYPPRPPDSTYRRTGTLGRKLGSAEAGGATMLPADIWEVHQLGEGSYRAEWGTRLSYAPYVIGTFEQAGHMGHWWTIAVVARNASPKIAEAFDRMAEVLAKWLEGKGAA